MIKRSGPVIVFIFIVIRLSGQETSYGPGFQTLPVSNPGYTGCTGYGTVRLSYMNFYPGNSYDFHTVFASYDAYFPAIHGGAGVYLSDDVQGGLVNDIRGGLSYAYFLQAGRELFINAGLSASFFHRGFNFNGAVLPDQIDQMGGVTIPPSETLDNRGRTVFDIGTGLILIYRNFFGGLGIVHLAEPNLDRSGASVDRMKRKYFFNVSADLFISEKDNLKIRPFASLEVQNNFVSASAGAVFESSFFSVNSILFFNNYGNVDLQTGFSLKKDRIGIYYNYKFSMKSGNSLIPFSLMHQSGLIFSLNNVEKRIKSRTIKLPGL